MATNTPPSGRKTRARSFQSTAQPLGLLEEAACAHHEAYGCITQSGRILQRTLGCLIDLIGLIGRRARRAHVQ